MDQNFRTEIGGREVGSKSKKKNKQKEEREKRERFSRRATKEGGMGWDQGPFQKNKGKKTKGGNPVLGKQV